MTTETSTTVTTPNTDAMNASCNELDLSWLRPTVVEAALNDPHMSLQDVTHLHSSLNMAETLGSMAHDIAEACHSRVSQKEAALVASAVQAELKQIWQSLGLRSVVDARSKWEQIDYMTECHGQGASIPMAEFTALDPDTVAAALQLFHKWIREDSGLNAGDFVHLPYAKQYQPAATAQKIHAQVVRTLAADYRALYQSVTHPTKSGYPAQFVKDYLKVTPEQWEDMLGVPVGLDSNAAQKQ